MTDRSKLLALAEELEAADGPSLVLDRDIALATYPKARPMFGIDSRITVWDGNGWTQLTVKPYTASLDRAMTLVPEGWTFANLSQGDNRRWWCELRRGHLTSYDKVAIGQQLNPLTPALALCAAALRAQAEALA